MLLDEACAVEGAVARRDVSMLAESLLAPSTPDAVTDDPPEALASEEEPSCAIIELPPSEPPTSSRVSPPPSSRRLRRGASSSAGGCGSSKPRVPSFDRWPQCELVKDGTSHYSMELAKERAREARAARSGASIGNDGAYHGEAGLAVPGGDSTRERIMRRGF